MAEDEEQKYQAALEKARRELASARSEDSQKYQGKIEELERKLAEAQETKERAISRAQQTKSGHVYIISNIGSFGENVYKIGMTRRLVPEERVKELGDASVPFDFDIHGMIPSDNAPGLEADLHRRFEDRRVNLVNERREFFSVTIPEIQAACNELKLDRELTLFAEAKEFRTTKSIRENQARTVAASVPEAAARSA